MLWPDRNIPAFGTQYYSNRVAIRSAIEQIRACREQQCRDENTQRVVVATYETGQGDGDKARVFKTWDAAWQWRDEIARERWPEISDDPYPDDQGDAYFDAVAGQYEFFTSYDATIED